MAAHYLDLLVLMGAAAWMLHLILLPDPANAAADSASRSHPSPAAGGLPLATGVPIGARRSPTKEHR